MGRSPSGWSAYYRAVEGRQPRETLLSALKAFHQEGRVSGQAIDLGAGSGRDALVLLRRKWSVLAIDGNAEGLGRLRQAAPPDAALTLWHQRFEEIIRLPGSHLINASFSLPFCPPAAFPGLWSLIRRSLAPGGRFAGQLLGEGDEWAADPGVTAFTREALPSLFAGFHVEKLEEEKRQSATAKGKSKYWHLYHIVLQRQAR